MLRQILCLVSVLLVTQCCAKPQFCRDYDCPEYKVKWKTDNYELRCYKRYTWATTPLTGIFLRSNKAFMRLFQYIEGDNDREMKINMTVPVLMEKEHGVLSTKEEMSFFIPFALQKNPPEPTNLDVYLKNISSFCVYVRTFGGYMTLGEWWHYWRLSLALKMDGLGDAYRDDYYYTASYNRPARVWKRHNEIWFVKK